MCVFAVASRSVLSHAFEPRARKMFTLLHQRPGITGGEHSVLGGSANGVLSPYEFMCYDIYVGLVVFSVLSLPSCIWLKSVGFKCGGRQMRSNCARRSSPLDYALFQAAPESVCAFHRAQIVSLRSRAVAHSQQWPSDEHAMRSYMPYNRVTMICWSRVATRANYKEWFCPGGMECRETV